MPPVFTSKPIRHFKDFSYFVWALILILLGICMFFWWSDILGYPVTESIQSFDGNMVARKALVPIPTTYNVLVSCYTASPDETDDEPFITADGTDLRKIKDNVVAINWLPLGTKVEIAGKKYVVRDRMNKRYGKHHVDILVKTKAEAFKCQKYQVLTVM